MKKYFSYSDESGFQKYDTMCDAIHYSLTELDDELTDSMNGQGLSANLESIMCGKITHYVNMFVPIEGEDYCDILLEEVGNQQSIAVQNDDSYSHDFNIGIGENYFNVTKKAGEKPIFNIAHNSASGCDTATVNKDGVIKLVKFLTGYLNDTLKAGDTFEDWS